MTRTRMIALALASIALTGCSTVNMFKNELAVVPGTGELRFISLYGPIGIASKIDSPARAASTPAFVQGK